MVLNKLVSMVSEDLASQYLDAQNFIGFIFANYTATLGSGFYVILLMIPTLGAYMKSGPGASLLVLMLGYGIFVQVLPAVALNVIIIIMVLSGGILLAWLFISRRN